MTTITLLIEALVMMKEQTGDAEIFFRDLRNNYIFELGCICRTPLPQHPNIVLLEGWRNLDMFVPLAGFFVSKIPTNTNA